MGKILYSPPGTAVEKRGLDLDPAVITKKHRSEQTLIERGCGV
jgi:hypothetical protein